MRDKKLISIILPVYNEAENIRLFLQALQQALLQIECYRFEYIIVNDGSSDSTETIVRAFDFKAPAKMINFSRNFGKESALTAGMEWARGDAVLLMDADFQHPIDMIEKLLSEWQQQGWDMVYAVRKSRKDEGMGKRFFTHCFYTLINIGKGPKLPVDAGDFRIIDRKVVDAILSCKERVRFMKGLYAWVGFKTKAIKFEVNPRKHGKSKWGFSRLFRYAVEGIIDFSDFPLQIWTVIGFCIAAASFLYGLVNIISALEHHVRVPGYPTLVTAIFFFGGVQLISIGVLGEYIARVFREVKARPTYVVSEVDEIGG